VVPNSIHGHEVEKKEVEEDGDGKEVKEREKKIGMMRRGDYKR
jgi:hypothetical protein